MAADDPTVGINVVIDPNALNVLQVAIERAIKKGFDKGFASLKTAMGNYSKDFKATADKIADAMSGNGKAFSDAEKDIFGYKRRLTETQESVLSFVQALKDAQTAVEVQAAAIKNASTELRKTQSAQRQAAITSREALSRQRQIEITELKNRGRVEFVQAQQQLIRERESGKKRIIILQNVLNTLTRLQKAYGRVLVGIAQTAVGAANRVFSTLGNSLRRQESVVNSGFRNALNTRERSLTQSFRIQEQTLSRSAVRQQEIIQKINQQTSTGVLGAVTGKGVGGGLLPGLAAGGGFAALLTSGYQRFNELERIQKQFVALTGSAEQAVLLLDEVKLFAKETPFDLVGVADLAKGFLAIKTPLDQVLPRVRAIADAVALTGGGVEELNRIQRAIGQVVSAGRLQGDELNQLAENLPGLNIRQILADQLTGGDVRALIEMQQAGEVTADMFVNGIITGLAGDPRLVGASADLAETLGGRVANLKESFSDVGAAIIGTVVVPLKFLVSGINAILQPIAQFIRGEDLGPVLQVLREGLKGVAIALGSVLAVKAGVQTLKILATVLSGSLFTPMGAFLAAISAVGAAISILFNKSEQFRKAVGIIGEYIGRWWRIIKATLSQAFQAIQQAIEPFFKTFQNGLGKSGDFLKRFTEVVLDKLDAVGRFLVEKVIPIFTGLVIVLIEKVGPALREIAGFISDLVDSGFKIIGDSIVSFLAAVGPLLDPAVEGFKALASAIKAAFGGDFSQLGSGIKDAFGGITQTFGNIGGAIGELLAPITERVKSFFKELFSRETLTEFARGFLGVVEFIGRTLGTIVSDPLFLKAVAAIGLAAVAIAGSFLKGFAEGVINNLPEILGMLQDAFFALMKKLFSVVLSNPLIPFAVAGLIYVLKPVLKQVASMFGMAGKDAGTNWWKGIDRGVRTGLAGVKASIGDFYAGVRRQNSQLAGRIKDDLQKEMNTLNKMRRSLGLNAITFGSGLNVDKIRTAQRDLRLITEQYSAQQIAGMRLRDTINNLSTAYKNIVPRLGDVIRGFSKFPTAIFGALSEANKSRKAGDQVGQGFVTGFTNKVNLGKTLITTGFRNIMQEVRLLAKREGTTVGAILGQSISTAGQAALAGAFAFQAGKAAGESGGGGLFAAATAGLSSGLLVGSMSGGPAGVAVGVLTAGISLLGTQLGKSKREADQFNQSVQNIATSINGEVIEAIENGVLSVAALKDGLDFGEINSLGLLQKQFDSLISVDAKRYLSDIGFTWQQVTNILKTGSPEDGVRDLGLAVASTATRTKTFRTLFGSEVTQIQKTADTLFASGEKLSKAEIYNKLLGSVDIKVRQRFTQKQTDALKELAANLVNVQDTGRAVATALGLIDVDVNFYNPKAKEQVKTFATDLMSVDEIAEILDTQINTLNDSIDNAFRPRDYTSWQEAIDVLSVQGRAAGGELLSAFQDFGVNSPEFRLATKGISDLFSEAIRSGVEQGVIIDAATAQPAIDEIKSYIALAFGDNPLLVQTLNKVVEDGFSGVALDGLIINAVESQETKDSLTKAQEFVTSELNKNPLIIDAIEILGGAGSEQGKKFLDEIVKYFTDNPGDLEAGSQAIVDQIIAGIMSKNPELKTLAEDTFGEFQDGFDERSYRYSDKNAMYFSGMSLYDGLEKAFIDSKVSLAQNGRDAAAIIDKAFRSRAGIRSPSKLMFENAKYLIDGLVDGIDMGLPRVAVAGSSMADELASATVSQPLSAPRLVDVTPMVPARAIEAMGEDRASRTVSAGESNVTINQTFMERVDSRAIASDIAWRLS